MKNLILISALLFSCTESQQRNFKTFTSEWTGGLDRCLSAYAQSGQLIKKWCGRFDIKRSSTEVLFDLDGKRVIVNNAVLIIEEQ